MKLFSAAAAVLMLSAPFAAQAASVDISSFDRGWYTSSGSHIASNDNIILSPTSQYRNFFAFDLSTVSLGSITSATLTIGAGIGTYTGSASTDETYDVYDFVSDIDSLLAGSGGTAAHGDLGTGDVYGSTTIVTSGTSGTMPEVVVTLTSAGISALNAALTGTDNRFVLGGSSSTLLSGEALWSSSQNIPGVTLTLSDTVAAVPLPAGLPLLLGGLGLMAAVSRRSRT